MRRIRITYRRVARVLTGLLLIAAAVEYARQRRDDAAVRVVAERVVAEAGATAPRDRAVALCQYLRASVSFADAPYYDRPFLRATAAETLASGRGYCGEVTRAFIALVRAEGIPAQRINLYGRTNHVVAVVDFGDGVPTLLDCQQPPTIAEPTPLDEVMRRPEFDSYSTLNLRRVGLGGVAPRLQLELGGFTRLSENPHLIKAIALMTTAAIPWAVYGGRLAFRASLRRRGWVHRSTLAAGASQPGAGRFHTRDGPAPPSVPEGGHE